MEEAQKKKEPEKPKQAKDGKKIAVVKVRGNINITRDARKTMEMLKLIRPNQCAVIDDTQDNLGMVMKIKDYVTWGEISDDVRKELQKRRQSSGKKVISYSLNPPRKGYGRKGVKMPFSKKGALGDRKEKINDLIKRML
ncbi:hypothetical protein GF351_03650 [Candidatus Woesearchaeota archaeon]|nr:hypothetical protein [Candidatus Woesearchaeota archaeon]